MSRFISLHILLSLSYLWFQGNPLCVCFHGCIWQEAIWGMWMWDITWWGNSFVVESLQRSTRAMLEVEAAVFLWTPQLLLPMNHTVATLRTLSTPQIAFACWPTSMYLKVSLPDFGSPWFSFQYKLLEIIEERYLVGTSAVTEFVNAVLKYTPFPSPGETFTIKVNLNIDDQYYRMFCNGLFDAVHR